MNSNLTQNINTNRDSQIFNQEDSQTLTQREYTATLSSMLLTTSLQEDYFCQQNVQQEQKGASHFGLNQNEPHKLETFSKQNTPTNEINVESRILLQEERNHLLTQTKQCTLSTNNNQDEEEVSMRSESDENYSAQQIPNTDEDTKENSEEDSPQIEQKSNIKRDECQKSDSDVKHQSQEYESLIQQSQIKTGKVTKDDFTLIQVIGTGSYGKVLLVKKKDSGKLYAMKMLKKSQLRRQKQVKNTWTERKILEKISHPFIVKMNYAFQNEKKLFFVLDYCPGGELFFYISQIGRFKEQSAKFYAANILLALECLHENGIVYREQILLLIIISLKPENILIGRDGYAKLTDFGLSKDNLIGDALANSFCGTAEYLAPEVINKKGYSKYCDWWSFGCVLYEMLTAVPPFYSKKRQEIYDKIRTKNPNFYNFHSPQSVDLLSKLLEKDPSKRLGSQKGAAEIKEHPFFADVDWDQILAKKIATPYKPLLDSKDDTKHFDKEICNIPIDSPQGQHSHGNYASESFPENINDEFDGFSFVAQTEQSANDLGFLIDQQ